MLTRSAGGGIQPAGADGAVLGVVVRPGGGVDAVVLDRGQPPVTGRAQGDALSGGGLMPAAGEHLPPGQHQLHRPAQHPGGRRSQQLVRVHETLAAEPAADKRAAHVHVVGGQPEGGRQRRLHDENALRGVLQAQLVTVPPGHRGGRFDRAVMAVRGAVGLADGNVSGGHPRGDVADREVGVGQIVGTVGQHGLGTAEAGRRLGLGVPGTDQAGRVLGLRPGACGDQGDGLALVVHPVVLHRDHRMRQRRHRRRRQPGHVGRGQHCGHAADGPRGRAVQLCHPPARHPGRHQDGM